MAFDVLERDSTAAAMGTRVAFMRPKNCKPMARRCLPSRTSGPAIVATTVLGSLLGRGEARRAAYHCKAEHLVQRLIGHIR